MPYKYTCRNTLRDFFKYKIDIILHYNLSFYFLWKADEKTTQLINKYIPFIDKAYLYKGINIRI